MPMPNTRFSRCAQVIVMDGMYAGFAGVKTGHRCPALHRHALLLLRGGLGFGALPPLCRNDQDGVCYSGQIRHDKFIGNEKWHMEVLFTELRIKFGQEYK